MNAHWKYELSNILCSYCDIYMVYHARTKRFYCKACQHHVELVDPTEALPESFNGIRRSLGAVITLKLSRS